MNDLKIVKGNTFETVVEVRAYKLNGEEIENFDLQNCTNISVIAHVGSTTKRLNTYSILDKNKMSIEWPGKVTKVGSYSLEVIGKIDDLDWRFYDKKPIFTIVNTNAEANVPQ